jgi:hypothetical protein
MVGTWEVKSSWVGAANTCPGRVIGLMVMILHQFGGNGGKRCDRFVSLHRLVVEQKYPSGYY